MRRKLCLALLLLLPALALNAQKPGYKYWSSGKLEWSDYSVGSIIPKEGAASSNSFGWETRDTTEEYGNLTVHRVASDVYLNKAGSWYLPGQATDQMLRYNQLFFDLNELYCRQMLREIYDPTVEFDVAFLQDYYIGLATVKMSEINIMSDYGNDSETVSYFDGIIQSQLSTLPRMPFNPKALKKGKHGFGAYGGLCSEIFMGAPASVLSPMFMMNFGLRYYYSGFFVDAGLGVGGLKTRKAISAGGEDFFKGQVLSDLHLYALAGYSVYDGPVFRIAPMAGIGYNGLSRMDSDEDEAAPMGLHGMRIMGGLDMDIKTSREAWLFPDDRSILENCINLRLYLAKTGFNADMDGLSLNIGITYAFQIWGLKSW